MPRTKEKPVELPKVEKAEKPPKEKEKAKKVVATNGAVDHRIADSFPMIKLIDQRIAESVPKEIIDKVNAVTDKRQIICSTYPYDKCIKNKAYEKEAKYLQIELVKMQAWIQKTGGKVVMLFEGRDAAGKGGTIKRFTEFLNPRGAPVVALTKPSESEKGQWYFQRYIEQLPTAGEIVSLTAPGTTAPGWSTSWASARRTITSSSCARRRSSSACSCAVANSSSSSGFPSAARNSCAASWAARAIR